MRSWLWRLLVSVSAMAFLGVAPAWPALVEAAPAAPAAGRWTVARAPTGGVPHLRSVAPISANNVWAVGDGGTMLHWNGSAWTALTPSPAGTTALWAVDFAGSSGWAVGAGGIMLQYNNGTWTQLSPFATTTRLRAVEMVGPDEAWAAGEGGLIMHWTRAGGWTTSLNLNDSTRGLQGLAVPAANNAWAVGFNGTIEHWNGSQWTQVPSPNGVNELRGISFTGPNDVWIAGDGAFLLHWDGSQWHQVANPDPDPTMTDGKRFILHTILMASPSVGFAGGHMGHIIGYDGSAWSPVASPVYMFQPPGAVEPIILFGGRMISTSEGWIVGQYGAILRFVPPRAFLPFAGR